MYSGWLGDKSMLCSILLPGSLFILMDHDRRSGIFTNSTIYYKPFKMIPSIWTVEKNCCIQRATFELWLVAKAMGDKKCDIELGILEGRCSQGK